MKGIENSDRQTDSRPTDRQIDKNILTDRKLGQTYTHTCTLYYSLTGSL